MARGGIAAPGLVAPASRGARAPGGVGRDLRPAPAPGVGGRGRRPVPTHDDRRACSGPPSLPTDGYVDPSQLTLALAKGHASAGRRIVTGRRVLGIDVRGGRVQRRGDRRRPRRVRRRRERGRDLRARDRRGWRACTSRSWPWRTSTPSPSRRGCRSDMPTLRDPARLVYFRGESGGLVAGGYERNPAPWGLGGIPADFNHQLLEPDWDRFAPLFEAATDARARAGRRRDRHADQRPRGLHPRRRVHPRGVRRARLLGGGGLLRARHRRRRGDGAAGGASGSPRASPGSTPGPWTRVASAPSTGAGATPWPGPTRSTPPTTT